MRGVASKAEADSERSRRTDTDQMKDSVRCCCPSFLKCLLRVVSDITFTGGHVDCDEMPAPFRLESSLVALRIDQLTSFSDLLRRIENSQVDGHFLIGKTLPHNIATPSVMPVGRVVKSPTFTLNPSVTLRSSPFQLQSP